MCVCVGGGVLLVKAFGLQWSGTAKHNAKRLTGEPGPAPLIAQVMPNPLVLQGLVLAEGPRALIPLPRNASLRTSALLRLFGSLHESFVSLSRCFVHCHGVMCYVTMSWVLCEPPSPKFDF